MGMSGMVQDIMAREQQMLGEDLGHFLTRLEGRPVSTDNAMAFTLQHVMDSTFPVRRSTSRSLSCPSAARHGLHLSVEPFFPVHPFRVYCAVPFVLLLLQFMFACRRPSPSSFLILYLPAIYI